jgi:hypothetical protein
MRIFGRKRKTTLKHKRFWLYLGLGAMLFRALLQASQTVFARRRFSEKMTAMSFVAKWMEFFMLDFTTRLPTESL